MFKDTTVKYDKTWFRANPRPCLMKSSLIKSITIAKNKTLAFCPETLELTIMKLEEFEDYDTTNAYNRGFYDGLHSAKPSCPCCDEQRLNLAGTHRTRRR